MQQQNKTKNTRNYDVVSSIGSGIEHFFGKVNWVEPELEGDVSAAPFGGGCKKGI